MSQAPEHIAGVTTHRRRGAIRHGFHYGVDYVLIDPEVDAGSPALFSRNRFNLTSVHDRDHGGPPKAGKGPTWARNVLAAEGLSDPQVQLLLLTQPRFLGYSFNPVSFWLALRDDALVAAIAEVSTPFGDRHSYLCRLPDFAPITRDSRITTPKSLHVSPFQEVAGSYEFGYDIRPDRIAIRILHRNGAEGVVATLSGGRAPLTNTGVLGAGLRRPFGALRTIALIHWQALRLKLKGAIYRTRPSPPSKEVT
ncbi:MAG: cyclopropane-fatty-acyl-phospholipid synthase [Alphaproteobacteria bacterium MedPE-SWcel]|nr:MAG: cyclopropane-fatty-acyl-phospholipid synthase [Alphaproteobacteria bacterium MedPE-SWcel]